MAIQLCFIAVLAVGSAVLLGIMAWLIHTETRSGGYLDQYEATKREEI